MGSMPLKRRAHGTHFSIYGFNNSMCTAPAALSVLRAVWRNRVANICSSEASAVRAGSSHQVCDATIRLHKRLNSAPSQLWWNTSGLTSRLTTISPAIPRSASPSTTELPQTLPTFLVIRILQFGLRRIRSERHAARQANVKASSKLQVGQARKALQRLSFYCHRRSCGMFTNSVDCS